MKRALFALAFLTLLTSSVSAQAPPLPRKASDIGIQIGTEKYTWLSEHAGKTCIVAFILTTCPHCQFTVGLLNQIQKDYADKGVQVIASAIEPMSSLHIPAFQKQFQLQFPVGYNEQSYVQKFLGLPDNDPMFMPQLVFVDRTGMVRAQYSGDDPALAKDIQDKSLREALEKTLKEGGAKTASPARTSSTKK